MASSPPSPTPERSFVLRSHSSDATTTRLRITQTPERNYTLNNGYTGTQINPDLPDPATRMWGQ